MNLINIVNDKTVSNSKQSALIGWNVRQAIRAVLFNEQKQIALMHIGAYDVYKLPGGGVKENENLETAFVRELLEETGCEAEKISDLGIFVEKRKEWKMLQISYCFLAKTVKMGVLELDEAEQKEKFTLHWIDGIEEAIKLVKTNKSKRYDDRYIRNRDLAILEVAKKVL
ncbi:NUDIX domain-containing protein [Patescibacteria group bacterium]|nr:NUDIX domain-containing protein [Patescibacteria group bacterium]